VAAVETASSRAAARDMAPLEGASRGTAICRQLYRQARRAIAGACFLRERAYPGKGKNPVREPLLETQGISKRFGRVEALRDVGVTIGWREIVGLVGDNGAGKSTFIKILSGALLPDSGTINFEGRRVSFATPLDARRCGIETVYQDLALATALDASGNLFLGRETLRPGMAGRMLAWLDKKEMREHGSRMLSSLGIHLKSVTIPVENLSGGQRQAVAVARALSWGTKLVIMDEPTAALGVSETAKVLELVHRIKHSGLSVIFISHNLPNVFTVADRIVVLRLGRTVGDIRREDATMESIVRLMTGADTGASAAPAVIS
jgi:ABC-type sugar transport system ATPase subunit